MFGKLNDISTVASKGKQSANAALSTAQQIQSDMGVNGKTPNLYTKLSNLADALKGIQNAR